ncbi:hypothetical protein YB2330_004133 [Saitoella coloradoensis]
MGKRDPRLYVLRHGQTAWSEVGKHTSFTDLSLTEKGAELVKKSAAAMVVLELIDPARIGKVFVSPRARAQETLALLGLPESIPVETTELLKEYDYGEYEGLLTKEIQEKSGKADWEIWLDGCPGGEMPEQVEARIDALIQKARKELHEKVYDSTATEEEQQRCDVLFVAHGHILRGTAARWLNLPLNRGRDFQLDAGGAGVLSYEHHTINEPAVNRWNLIAF